MDNLKRGADFDIENDIIKKRQRLDLEQKINLGAKREQVINILKREFRNEINKRQDEVHLIQQRLLKTQKTLHLLKYVIIRSFYDKKELKITNNEEPILKSQEITSINSTQSRIHPAVKKLLGKKPAEHVTHDFARTRGQVQNIDSLFLSSVKEEIEINEEQNTLDLDVKPTLLHILKEETKVPIRNRQKIKHEIVIGNISKYSPSNNSNDASTHKWMVYVRGPRDNPDISNFVRKVRFFLHPSYQPNDIVDLEKAPFHLSRRGWGEFPLRLQIHFQNNSNKPVDVIHNLKLDQNRTGRQTLGSETLLNVWLYDTSILEENESILESDDNIIIKKEIEIPQETFEPQPCCSKDTFDTSSTIKSEIFDDYDYNLIYLVDHCYTETKIDETILEKLYSAENQIIDREKYKFKIPFDKFGSIRQTVYFLFKRLPLISKLAKDLSYKCCYPYVAETMEEFLEWSYAKRCCQEWYRAKTIKTLLEEQEIAEHEEWSTKFILMFGRAHLFTPFPNYNIFKIKTESGKTVPNHVNETDFTSTYTEHIPISTLREIKVERTETEEEEFVDVENLTEDIKETKIKRKQIIKSSETDPDLFPVCNYIKKCAAQLDIHLTDEEIEPGVLHNSSERVLLQSVTCLIEELIRTAWATKVIERKGRNLDCPIEKYDIFRVLLERPEFDIFTNEGLGKAVT